MVPEAVKYSLEWICHVSGLLKKVFLCQTAILCHPLMCCANIKMSFPCTTSLNQFLCLEFTPHLNHNSFFGKHTTSSLIHHLFHKNAKIVKPTVQKPQKLFINCRNWWRKGANPYNYETRTSQCLKYGLEKWLKQSNDYKNSWQLIFSSSTNRFIIGFLVWNLHRS